MKTMRNLGIASTVGLLSVIVGCTPTNQVPCTTDADCEATPDTPVCGEAEGFCVSGGDGSSAPAGDDCTNNDPTLGAGDPVCLDQGKLCGSDTNCTAPADVTDTCTSGYGNGAGPITYAVDEISNDGDSPDCAGSQVYGYIASVYSDGVALDQQLFTQRITYDGGLSFSEAGGGIFIPDVSDEGAGDYLVTFYTCGDGAGAWVGFSNNDNVDGNAFCF